MDENFTYHSSSNRPDIDAAWQQMQQLLDKEMPAAGDSGGNNNRTNRRWGLGALLLVITGVIIWYHSQTKSTEKNLTHTVLKNDTVQNNTAENTAGIKDSGKNISAAGSLAKDDSIIKNRNQFSDTANAGISKANTDMDLKATGNNLQTGSKGILTAHKNVVLLNNSVKNNIPPNTFNNTTVNDQQSNSITKNTFKDYLQRIYPANTNDDTAVSNTQKNKSVNNDFANADKDVAVQSSPSVDSSEAQRKMAANSYTKNDSADTWINASTSIAPKTKDGKKKKNTFSLLASLSAGISPSLSFQHTGYANSSGLNYLAAADVFVIANIPLSKRFSLQAGLHPFAGVPLRSDTWKHSLQNLDETHSHTDTGHTVTTFTTSKIAGLTSLNIPVTLHYNITPKLNVYAGFQASAFLYGGVVKHSFITDSSAFGIHTSSTSASANIFKTSHSNAIKKMNVNGMLGVDYSFNHFTLGLQYIYGFSDVTGNSFLHNSQLNTIRDLKLSVKINLYKQKK